MAVNPPKVLVCCAFAAAPCLKNAPSCSLPVVMPSGLWVAAESHVVRRACALTHPMERATMPEASTWKKGAIMKLHEYQARDILAKYGIPVTGGGVAGTAAEARGL